jgi:hypothetical protein
LNYYITFHQADSFYPFSIYKIKAQKITYLIN